MYGRRQTKIVLLNKKYNEKFRADSFVYRVYLRKTFNKVYELDKIIKKLIKKDKGDACKLSLSIESYEFEYNVYLGLTAIDEINGKYVWYIMNKINSQKNINLFDLKITFNYFNWKNCRKNKKLDLTT